jgi:hypothetical protein
MPESTPINVEPNPAGNVVTSRKANSWLIGLGAIMVIAVAIGVFYARDSGSETVETSPPAQSNSSQPQATVKTTKSAPSDSLLTTVLGAGAALIIIGVLYGRISTIKLPGGVEIGLTKNEEDKAAKMIGEKLKEKADGEVDPVETAKATQEAADLLLQAKARVQAKAGPIELPEDEMVSVVEKVVEQVPA